MGNTDVPTPGLMFGKRALETLYSLLEEHAYKAKTGTMGKKKSPITKKTFSMHVHLGPTRPD